MWGLQGADQNYKSVDQLIQLLVRTASKGANLLLNVGPQPDGNLPAAAVERLEAMGEWLQVNGESIYGTATGSLGDGKNVVSTRRGTKGLRAHLGRFNQNARFAMQRSGEESLSFGGRHAAILQIWAKETLICCCR